MSIATEITKLKTNLSAAYLAVENRGGTIPANKNFDNLQEAILSIEQNGDDVSLYTVSNNVITQPTIDITGKFDNITSIEENGLAGVFSYHTNVTGTLSFPSLTAVGNNGLSYAFFDCTQISGTMDLSKVHSIGDYGMSAAFVDCKISGVINFSSLTSVGTNAFGETSGQYTFTNTNITEIHFPAAIEDTIKALNGYSENFGATNATISFDL